jgi:hypothetical protein
MMGGQPIKREFDGGLPPRMSRLPLDKRGYPVPAFVEWFDGEPDFRVMSQRHLTACVKQNRCWICGDVLGARKVFVIGPMCCINRVSAEPPSHYECALFAARNCPFLSKPLAKRGDLSDVGEVHVAGLMLERNPGVCALWVTKKYKPFNAGNGVLFDVGDPERVEFYAKGRKAFVDEIDESVVTGLPFLEEAAEKDGPMALKQLQQMKQRFERDIRGKYA